MCVNKKNDPQHNRHSLDKITKYPNIILIIHRRYTKRIWLSIKSMEFIHGS
jgi:hypothetical protein